MSPSITKSEVRHVISPHITSTVVAVTLAAVLAPAWAQQPGAVPAVDQPQMDHSRMGRVLPSVDMASSATGPDRPRFDHGTMQGGDPPSDARDPHAYSGGYVRGPLRLADEHTFGFLLMDRFETARTSNNSFTTYDLQGRFGRDYDRFVIKAEGEIDGGKIEDAHTELFWSRAMSAYWDAQLGLRYDSGIKPERKWLAFGFQGLSPYWFEIDATAYVSESGRTALRLEAEYELLLTQKWVLQPRFEADFYGKRDDQRELGSGLSGATLGFRLRYEIRREFAPYLGIERSNKYGGTADFARAEDKRTSENRIVAGLRFWF